MYNENKSYVYVLAKDGTPLMPTKRHRKVQIWLREGKAKVIRREPFTIRLLYEPKTKITQDINLGIDPGSGTLGVAAIGNNSVLYASEVTLRNDIKQKMSRRRELRRDRRNRKTRYRKCKPYRKNSLRVNRYSPTLISKEGSHEREIEFVRSILPIKNQIIEEARFDLQKMNNPNIFGWQYQRGPLYGYICAKDKVLKRDDYTCQHCKAKSSNKNKLKLNVHHIIPKSKGGSDNLENLIVLCKDCHEALHKGLWKLNLKGKLKDYNKANATQTDIIVSMLKKKYPNMLTTRGYVTKTNRQELELPKTHWIDAAVIASGGEKFDLPSLIYKKKRVTKYDYAQTKYIGQGIPHPEGKTTIPINTKKINGFRKFDKIEYFGKQYFIACMRKNGGVELINLDGSIMSSKHIPYGYKAPNVYKGKMKRIIARNGELLYMEKLIN